MQSTSDWHAPPAHSCATYVVIRLVDVIEVAWSQLTPVHSVSYGRPFSTQVPPPTSRSPQLQLEAPSSTVQARLPQPTWVMKPTGSSRKRFPNRVDSRFG